MEPNKFIDLVKKELGFLMENHIKVSRAVYGMATSKGLVDGVGENASPEIILAKYDEIGGFITKNGYKVKNRTFFDPKTKKPVENPKIVLLIKMNGEFVEHEEGADESFEIKVAKKQFEEKKRGRPKKEKE